MTDTARLEEIRERLGKATPGPWAVDPDERPGMEYNNHVIQKNGNRICFMAHGGPSRQAEFDATAALIANAPDDIEWLTIYIESQAATISRLEGELSAAREALKPFAFVAEFVPANLKDTDGFSLVLKVADWRRARALGDAG